MIGPDLVAFASAKGQGDPHTFLPATAKEFNNRHRMATIIRWLFDPVSDDPISVARGVLV
jgi:hypothetical protein